MAFFVLYNLSFSERQSRKRLPALTDKLYYVSNFLR